MSFESMKYFSLQKAARIMAVNVDDCKSSKSLIEKFNNLGITYDMYQKALLDVGVSEDAPKKAKIAVDINDESNSQIVNSEDGKTLVTMAVMRGVYKIQRHYFTLEQPFKLLSSQEANSIIKISRGNLREASPKEVAEYYGIN
jgi:hypothetical protein